MSRFWSKNIPQLTPYTPGEQPRLDNLIKLNTNENPYGPSPNVIAAIKVATNDDLRKYPDPNAQVLKDTIAKTYNLTAKQVFVGNSSDEVLAHAFKGLLKKNNAVLIPDITYSFYPVWCQLFNIELKTIPLNKDFTINVDGFKQSNDGIIFANPNAPTGIALELERIEEILRSNPDSVVIIDEAYADFSDDSAIKLIDQYPNLLVTQTLSKSRSLAGLRVGFACGNSELIEGLERVKNSFHPYALNQLAIAGAVAAFEDTDYFADTRQKVINTRNDTAIKLNTLGFVILPSQSNFLMIKHPNIDAEKLFQMLREQGVVVRYFSAPRINEYIRISIGTEYEMTSLIEEIEKILSAQT